MIPTKQVQRPRVLKWYQAGAILYGDWGSSKAYVLGIAFVLSGHASWFFLGLMACLNALVGYCYTVICRVYKDGGGAYSALKSRSKSLGTLTALLLFADYAVTAALSAYVAFCYFEVAHPLVWSLGAILFLGSILWMGPFKLGTLAAGISTLASLSVLVLVFATLFHIPEIHLEWPKSSAVESWSVFSFLILALSGVETIANLTGVMAEPVEKTSRRAILPVLVEVSVLTFLLGIAMNALPHPLQHSENMLRGLGDFYIGAWYGTLISVLFGALLLYQILMALTGMINMQFLLAVDREFPSIFRKLNRFGVPIAALMVAIFTPVLILIFDHSLLNLASLYAVGVVGAIMLNLGNAATHFKLDLKLRERFLLGIAAFILLLIEITICLQKHNAFFYVVSILAVGFMMRKMHFKHQEALHHTEVDSASNILTLAEAKEIAPLYKCSFLVAIRSVNSYLILEAVRRAKALGEKAIYLDYVQAAPPVLELPREIEPSQESLEILKRAQEEIESHGLTGIPLWQFGVDVGRQIARAVEELGVNTVLIGTTKRSAIVSLLRGDVLLTLAGALPPKCRLIISG